MGTFTVSTHHVVRRALFTVAGLFWMVAAQAQNINVAAANALPTNGKVYSLNFSSGITTTVDNTDYKSFLSIESMAFIVNSATTALDLVVADEISGKIAVYPGDFTPATPTTPAAPTTATVIWKPSMGGPAVPNGLSVDALGDLWVVNQLPGKPQLWVFPAAGTNGCVSLAAYAALCAPVLVDATFARGQLLVETTSVPAVPTGGKANTGDLLVLTLNPSTVIDYPKAGSFSPMGRNTLITLPNNSTPAGMAFWPLDDSLLISNSLTNQILRYSCCSLPAQMANFASGPGGLGKLMFKIKTGYQNGAPLAFVAQTTFSGGDLLEFGEGPTGSGVLLPPSPITQNVEEPVGLAVSNAAFAAANTCTSQGGGSGGCNPTGLLAHFVPAAMSPALVENICVVQDPRVTVVNNVWSCTGQPLIVNTVCPGFDNTGNNMFIPGSFCGKSGDSASSSPQGFTLIRTLINDSQFTNVLVDNEATVAMEPTCLPGPSNNPTLASVLWGPLADQGTFVADGKTNEMLDRTDGCGSVHAGSSGGSLWALGLVLNPAAIVPEVAGTPPSPGGPLGTLGDNKYLDLETTIESTLVNNITPSVAAQLATASGPSGCVPLSQSFFDFAQLEGANPTQQTQDYTIAADLLSNAGPSTCDSIVEANLGAFTQTTTGTPVLDTAAIPRAGFAAGYFLINSRILGNAPNAQAPAWPPNPAPPAPPGTFSTLPPPPDTQTSCVPSGLYPPPGGCPILTAPGMVVAGTQENVSFTLYGSNNGTGGCTLTSNDGTFSGAHATASPLSYPFSGSIVGTVPAGTTPGSYADTLTCAYPDSANQQNTTVSTQVIVLAPPTLSAPASVAGGSPVTVSWTLNGSSACTLTGSDGENSPATNSPNSLTYTPSVTAPTTITYTLACTTPGVTSTTAPVSITGAPASGPPTLSLNPTSASGGVPVTVTWVLNGNTGCSLSDDGYGTHTPAVFSATASGSGTYVANPNDSGQPTTGPNPPIPYGVTFILACSNTPAVYAYLPVSE